MGAREKNLMIWDDLRHWVDEKAGAWAKTQGLDVLPFYTIEEPPTGISADAACNLAMILAKPLKTSPRAIAQALQKELLGGGLVTDVHIAGAGFLNFTLALDRLQNEVTEILKQRDSYGRRHDLSALRILIEFVSANPTGPLHVGHGRGAALGDSLALILAHIGYSVDREYYINDAGNQVQLLGYSLIERCKELKGQPFELPQEGYHGDYLKDVARAYVESHPERLPDLETATLYALERLLKSIEADLIDFGVTFQTWFSEAGLSRKGLVEKYIADLRRRGFVRDHEDAVWFVAPDDKDAEKDKDRVLKRRDGRWTYFATDIAYHADKYDRGYDRLIDIWGADHHGYVARVKGSMQALGHDPGKLHVLLYQLVSLTRDGVPVSMSKRTGDFILLRDVVQEVGRDACRFFFALRGPNTAMDFDLELAKKHSNDNPVYYAQYAHARICSIFRQSPHPPFTPTGEKSQGEGAVLGLLKEPEERDLIRRLSLFSQTLHICAQEDSPHPLANYALSLCRQFHHFYDHHRVLGDDPKLTQARLALLDAVRTVLALSLKLLGVSAPESM